MRIALGIEYDGSKYFGWQRQQEVVSVQQYVEGALSKIADQPVEIFCAGRTDAGVHATGQVVHFNVDCQRRMAAWTLGVNSHLPEDIAVRWAKVVASDFHARFSATARQYRYIIYNSPYRGAILGHGVSHYHSHLNETLMHQAGQCLLGEHDFTSFRAVQCQSRSPFRYVHYLNVVRKGDFVIIDIKANAFVHHMVRNIAGSLIEVGQGKHSPEWIEKVLALKDRTKAAATAKAQGLYLVAVDYPASFAIPESEPGPLFYTP